MRVNGSCLVGSSPGKVTVPLEPGRALVNNDLSADIVKGATILLRGVVYNVIANSLFCTIIEIYTHTEL